MGEHVCLICRKPLTDDYKGDQFCLRCCEKYGIRWDDSIMDINEKLLKNIADECREKAKRYEEEEGEALDAWNKRS